MKEQEVASETIDQLVQQLLDNVPEVRPILKEHLSDNFGELLPHVLFGDLTRWAQDAAASDSEPDSMQRNTQLDVFLEILERALMEGDEYVRELLHVSFVENVETDSALFSRLGPTLRRGTE